MPKLLEEIRSSDRFMKEEEEADILDKFSETIVASPPHWEMCALPIELEWHIEKFDTAGKSKIPDDCGGVYTFVVQPSIANHSFCSYLFYVGKVEKQTFRKRFYQYLRTKGDPRTKRLRIRKMLNRWEGYLWFCYAKVNDKSLIDKIEQSLQDSYVPPYNKEFRGAVGPAQKVLR